MSRFKEGDKVRVIGHPKGFSRDFLPIGTVCAIDSHNWAISPVDGSSWEVGLPTSCHTFELTQEDSQMVPKHPVQEYLENRYRKIEQTLVDGVHAKVAMIEIQLALEKFGVRPDRKVTINFVPIK